MIGSICTSDGAAIPHCVTILAIAYMLFETWLGRTKYVDANSTGDLFLNGLKWLWNKLKGNKP